MKGGSIKEWREKYIMSKNTNKACKGCQWEDTCEFDCPCDFHTGREEIENAVDYIVSLFECIEDYQKVTDELEVDCR